MSRKLTSVLVVFLALFLITAPAWSGNSNGPNGPPEGAGDCVPDGNVGPNGPNGANSGHGPHGPNGDGDGDGDGPNGPNGPNGPGGGATP